MTNNQKILDLTYEAGAILLENGAEISRVEGTMRCIADILVWKTRVSSCSAMVSLLQVKVMPDQNSSLFEERVWIR